MNIDLFLNCRVM